MNYHPRVQRYRWEATYAADFTLDSLTRRCMRFATVLNERGWSCLVAYDTRFLSSQFAGYAAQLLRAAGARVALSQTAAPIPAVELAIEQKQADCALVISAGNLHYWYNGMLLLAPPDPALAEITAMMAPETVGILPATIPFPPGEETDATLVDIRGPYNDMLRAIVDIELIRRSSITVFVDTMHGTLGGVIPALIGEGAQTKAIEINRENDPLFGRRPPQPVEAGLQRLRKLVKESDSHCGVALSADGRAIVTVDNTGELVAPGELALFLAGYLARQYRQKGTVVVPRPADTPPGESAALRAWEQATGLKSELATDPAARIAELLSQDRNSMLAGVTAAGELTLGRYGGSPDAALAALLLIEMIARSGGKLRAQLDQMRTSA